MSAPLTVLATSINTELIEVLGSISAIFAMLGFLLLLPIYISHRREVERLLAWKERNPDAGTTEFRAIPGPSGVSGGTGGAAPSRPGGKMTPAERVTSERPALRRISTGEYAAVEPEPQGFWQRVIERGPRHPLVLTILAIVVGVVAVFLASQLIRSDDDSSSGGGAIDPADVQVAILSATSEPGSNPENDFAAACARFTQDNHVEAVLGYDFTYYHSFEACLGKRGVPHLSTGFNVADPTELAKVPLFRSLDVPTIDRRGLLKVDNGFADKVLTTAASWGSSPTTVPVPRGH